MEGFAMGSGQLGQARQAATNCFGDRRLGCFQQPLADPLLNDLALFEHEHPLAEALATEGRG